jgi:hypothetical protein
LYQRGDFKQAFERVQASIDSISTQRSNDEVDAHTLHYFYKLHYSKAKLQRKMRLLTDAEATCDFLIDSVSNA